MTQGKLIPKQEGAVAEPQDQDVSVSRLIAMAVNQDLDVEKLERLVAMQERFEEKQAIRDFNAAFAKFQRECPPLTKNKTANIVSKSGASWSYDYASLDHLLEVMTPVLAANGFSLSYDTDDTDPNTICVIAKLLHEGGHEKTATYRGPVSPNAKVSKSQEHRGSWNFIRRTATESLLGIAAKNADTDGNLPGEKPQALTLDQQEEIRQLLDRLAPTDATLEAFWKFAGATSLEEIHPSNYRRIVDSLNKKLGQA